MAKWTPTEFNGQPARLYEDGSIRNERGHFLIKHPQGYTIAQEDASALAHRKHERKRERIQAGALAAVREKLPDKFDGQGDDWIEAVAEAVAYKALDRLDPKQVDAARFLLKEAGYGEEQGGAVEVLDATAGLLREISIFARQIAADNSNYRKHEVIDGQSTDDGVDTGAEAELPADTDDGDG